MFYYAGTDWSVCDSNPCPEGHACVEDTGGAGYSCECPKGTMGVDCRDDDTSMYMELTKVLGLT